MFGIGRSTIEVRTPSSGQAPLRLRMDFIYEDTTAGGGKTALEHSWNYFALVRDCRESNIPFDPSKVITIIGIETQKFALLLRLQRKN